MQSIVFVDASRQSLKLDPFDFGVFTEQEDVLQNVLTHSTSPEAYRSIIDSGVAKGSVSSDIRYDGFASDVKPPRSVFFATHPESDGALIPCARYPRHLADGAALKILKVSATALLDDRLEMFYVASTPTQFGPEYLRVYQTHIFVIHKDDHDNMALAKRHFVPIDRLHNALLSFEGDQARIATAVRVSGRTFRNNVSISFCNSFKLKPNETMALDGKKFSFQNGKVSCPHDMCEFQGISLQHLKRHYLCVHLKLKLHSCEKCEKSFARERSLRRHFASAHDRTQLSHKCAQCSRSFWCDSQLKTHVASVHERIRTHACPTCAKTFSRASHLKSHIGIVHEKQRLHKCTQCDKSFSTSSNLKAHRVGVHANARAHACDACGKTFSRNSTLKRHMLGVHANERLHECTRCSKSFSSAGNLRTHIDSVHEKKRPHACTQCDSRFAQMAHLKRHMLKMHD